ncbi:zinc finger FYVE domain-containing protein 26 isoform X2 [Clupea harengus]|uniref:Zinc finger FYVE domain-containing protein 26 n=1 Tax=Clupea harengus TaxID=7950 RepID=A0A6P8G9V3_CLUHA|nr:zinc finger FYVE domain-containing protein 26 isoform X2 [Clupea harengus]
MFPFGREEENSLEELFSFFKRCLKHGEWELAAACVPQLGQTPGGVAQELRDIIWAIVKQPYPLAWGKMGSPHKLAWFWMLVLEDWTKEKVPEAVRTELEFMLVLEELGQDVPEKVLKEFQQAFWDSRSDRKMSVPSAEVQAWVQDLLRQGKPRLAEALVSFLRRGSSEGSGCPWDYSLQDIFIQHLLEKLQEPPSEVWAEEVASVLALMPWSAERPKAELEGLWEALWKAKEGPLNEGRVLSSLLRPKDYTLVTHYSSASLRLLREQILREAPHTEEELPEAEKLMLGLCCHGDRPTAWKAIYFECLSSGKHFLEQVLVTGLDLVKRQEVGRLEEMLQGEFQPLARLMLLLGWPQCPNPASARILLQVLHHQQPSASDTVLSQFADSLASQLGVLEWCAKNNPSVSEEALQSQLLTLGQHSALYVLHSLTPLAQYEERQVLDLLHGLTPSGHTAEFSDPGDARSLAAQRNITLFQGFCAMKYALYAICVNAHTHTDCKECGLTSQQHNSPGSPEKSEESSYSEDAKKLFQHYLSECQLYLEAVPALFRLELLENIFSLLFLSSTDLTLVTEQKPSSPTLRDAEPGNAQNKGTIESVENQERTCGDVPACQQERPEGVQRGWGVGEPSRAHLDLGHLTQGCWGFLADVKAMEGFLRLLREGLEGLNLPGPGQDEQAAIASESLGCSVTAETFEARLQRLSKRTAEAQWRLQVVTKNQHSGDGGSDSLQMPSPLASPAPSLRRGSTTSTTSSSSSRRRRRPGRHRPERHLPADKPNGDFSTSTSDGGGGTASGRQEHEACPCGGPHSWLVPAMLAPPESLLVSCIRRGNFVEAHQVMLMFGLESSSCAGELVFMERYREVLQELAQVEQKIESQSLSSSSSSEGLGAVAAVVAGQGRSRLGSSGRSTLQAIGSAAAAGMAFYSISDVAERLTSSPQRPIPALEEDYWLSQLPSSVGSPDPSSSIRQLLEELSPPAMAAFDLAVCHSQLWKSSRQLLETAERRLNTSLEARELRLEPKVPHADGIRGFPAVLQQISKILNRTATGKGPAIGEGAGEEATLGSPFGCSAQEVMLSCHPVLTEEAISSRLSLGQRLEHIAQILNTAADATAEGRSCGALLAALVEQASLKQAELDAHPVRSAMKQLLRVLDQLCPFEPDVATSSPDYVRTFLDYVNTLASVLVRSMGSDADQSAEVKLGNPLLVLQQSPSQLLSYLLFERQVSAERLSSLLQQEGLGLSVEQVMDQHCCEPLLLWDTRRRNESDEGGAFSPARIAALLQEHAHKHNLILDLPPSLCSELSSQESSEGSTEESRTSCGTLSTSPSSSSSSVSSSSLPSSSFLLTPSALAFLKSRSPLLAILACLGATRGGVVRPSTSWPGLPSYFRSGGRKEAPLDAEQISREAEALLQDFPILRDYLHTMAEPVLGAPPQGLEAEANGEGLGAALCGTPLAALVLSGPQSAAAQALVVEAFQQALSGGELERALTLLELYGQGGDQQEALRDQLLACAAQEAGQQGWEHLFRVQDTNLQARVALQVLDQWPLGACRELLEFCLSKSNMDASLEDQLQKKKQEMDMYHNMLSLQSPLPWEMWQELREESQKDPEAVMALLLETREFELCAQWLQLYPVSEQSRLQLQTEHLLHLLEKGLTDEACQLLEGVSDPSRGLEVCERALDRQPTLAACHFLSDYLTVNFESRVSPARRRHIHALHLGSKVLLTLPEASRQSYFPLLSSPLLMLEQLLMNLKVEWADVAVRTLRNLLVDQEGGFSNDDIDMLLSDYARKALEFSCTPRERLRSDSVISLQDAYLQCPAQESCPASPSVTPPSSAVSTPMHTPSSSGWERGSSGRRAQTPATPFTPPPKPPVRKDWIPDHQEPVCMVCQRERFTMFNRRHHCRRCGRLVCQACSSHRMAVEGCEEEEEVRVCNQCYNFFHPDSDDELEQAEASSPAAAQGALEGAVRLPEVPERRFRLSINPADNQKILSEFYYEQAPSASLCVSILSLHSDPASCGHQLIDHCRSLSRTLTNPEVDARLITDVMRQLLFSAKVMFVKTGQSQDLALCDSYISKVDVLTILVTANYKYIPSLDDILEAASVSRLRNQLLEAEYYQLAVEVSTKSGLDPSGVWHAWGMACLKAGFLSRAREKFARYLKPPVDRGQHTHGPRLLQEILQHLEANIRPTAIPMLQRPEEDILASLWELEEALAEPHPLERPEGHVQNCRNYQESLHYLQAYGTHLALVSFYMRHDGMKEALSHLLSKECPEEVFLEAVLMPSLERGRLGVLQAQLESLDPTLEGWSRYLIASCQLLQRRGHFHTIYQLQQFMTDHVRAAMTCIRFFTHGAQSYLQLGEQQRWLVRAKEHLKTYLQEQQGRGAGRKKSLSSSFRKKMSASDVSRHMNTIELQLEVTRFLHRCATSSPSKPTGTPTPTSTGKTSAPPTLFGGGPMKIDVACKVMLGGKNIEEGFGIAYRVIQDFQLEALSVYERAGQRLVRQRQYSAVRQLLKCVGESGTATKNDCDAIVLRCISVADKAPADAKELEGLILECKSPENKIKAYLQCSKLRAAYLLAVKLEPARSGPLVQEVLQAAESSGDSVMENICRQWLAEHQDRPARQRQGRPSAR